MKQLYKILVTLFLIAICLNTSRAQTSALEFPFGFAIQSTGLGAGPTVQPLTFQVVKSTIPNTGVLSFSDFLPVITVKTFFSNQQYSGLSYVQLAEGGNGNGLTFGASGIDHTASGLTAVSLSTLQYLSGMGGNGFGPTSSMYSALGTTSGKGISADQSAFYNGSEGTGGDGTGAIPIFTCVQPLTSSTGGAQRVYMGDLVITFSQPVLNPVIHLSGLGGDAAYKNPSNQVFASYFYTELDLATTGYTSTLVSGNQFFTVTGNNITNNSTIPNSNSIAGGGNNNLTGSSLFNAASGSIMVNGIVTSLTYKLYAVQTAASTMGFSYLGSQSAAPGGTINPLAAHDPVSGDLWAISYSFQNPVVLPIKGLSLTANLSNNNTILNWHTSTELNSNHFEVERSLNGIDFTSITNKAAAVNSNVTKYYNYTDINVSGNIIYYRIKEVDENGAVTYSNIVTLRSTSLQEVKAWPNPFTDQVNINLSSQTNQNILVKLMDNAGKTIKVANLEAVKGNNQFTLTALGTLPSSLYLLQIISADGLILSTQKLTNN